MKSEMLDVENGGTDNKIMTCLHGSHTNSLKGKLVDQTKM